MVFNKVFFSFLLILGLCSAYKWKRDAIPNPFTDPPTFCGLKENGSPLCDLEQQLTPTHLKYILDKQKDLTSFVKCPCSQTCKEDQSGLVVGFVIVKEYDSDTVPNANEANPQALQDFSEYVRNKWSLGTCDNSVLITIATEPKQYGISIGERARQILNDTWYTSIMDANFQERSATYNLFAKIKDTLYMLREAIAEEMKRNDDRSDGLISSLTDSNSNSIWYTVLIIGLILLLIIIIVYTLYVVLKHRKENDDVSIKDVWTKKFWLTAGNQYKEAKQSESSNEKDVEKHEEEEVKVKLASTEDLKEVIDNESGAVEFPGKSSKV